MALVWDSATESYIDDGGSYDFGYGDTGNIYGPVVGEESPVPGYVVMPDGTVKSYAELDALAGVEPGTTYTGTDAIPTGTAAAGTSGAVNPATAAANKLLGTNLTDKQFAALGVGAGGLAGLLGAMNPSKSTSGYQGGIPHLVATRQQVPQSSTPREYGAPAMGRQYFTDTQYTTSAGVPAARAAAAAQAQELAAAQEPALTGTINAAHGGLMAAAKGRYLRGDTDGMADDLRTSIDGDQPAALSHGEFVIPADVVSHLGNGNSDAGAKKLYSMMDKVRQARTGTKKQGKEINPDKFMPGGLAAAKGYAAGGDVTGTAINAGLTGTESNLSNWAGPYVTNMLGQGAALANQPYQAYGGQMTAGVSPLQQQAFNQAGSLQTPGAIGQAANTAGGIAQQAQNMQYTPTTTSFGSEQAQQYMNPYLQAALAPQMAEMQRQNQIANMGINAKLTQAGGFGGGRQAVYNAENQRNMLQQMNQTLGQGYSNAFQQAQQQFNADQARKAQEAQFGASYGLQGLNTALQGAGLQGQLGTAQNQAQLANLGAQAGLGAQQRDIEQQALTAQQNEFNVQRENPYKMVQFQQSLLQGLPLAAQNYNVAQPSPLQSLLGGAGGLAGLLKTLGYDLTLPSATSPAK